MIRIARKPPLWLGFLGRALFGLVWAGGTLGATYLAWRSGKTPIAGWIVLGILDLFAVGILWDVVVRFWRTLTGKQPVVEIDRDSLGYGATAQLRIAEPHPESLADIDVRLVAEHWVTVKEGNTTTKTHEPCYDEQLLYLNVNSPEPISRMLQIRIPDEFPDIDPTWKILVNTTLKQGGIMQHAFPLKIQKRRQI